MMKAPSTMMNTARTNVLPFATAVALAYPPARFMAAITAPTFHMTWPPGAKTTSAPRLVAKLAIFALALASKNA